LTIYYRGNLFSKLHLVTWGVTNLELAKREFSKWKFPEWGKLRVVGHSVDVSGICELLT